MTATIAEMLVFGFQAARRHGAAIGVLAWSAILLAPLDLVDAQDPPPLVLQAERSRIAAVADAVQTAVCVFGAGGQGGGSGAIVTADGYALTNFHVVKPVGSYMQCGLADGRLYDAVLVGVDPTGDIALIKLLGREDFPCAPLADSDAARAGDECFVVGNPFLLATDFQPTVTYGIISGVHRYQYPSNTLLEYTDCIQTDAAINPGNSGGPLFDRRGRLLGVVGRASFEKRGRVNVGVGYAVSINQVKNFMGHLRSGRVVDHASLGATVSSDDQGRVRVANILESSSAYRRGLRFGDEIIALGGRDIGSVNTLKNVLGIFPKGWTIPLSFRSEGRRRDVWVRLSGLHSTEELLAKIERPMKPPGEPPPEPPDPEGPPPGEKDPRKTPRPLAPHGPPVREPPKQAAALIEKRHGYANYYFNTLSRDRVWNAWTAAAGDFRSYSGAWRLVGRVAADGDAELLLENNTASAQLPSGPASLDASRDLTDQLAPAGSGAVLAALHLWRRLLIEGPRRFGEVYYLGTTPLPDREGLLDVLVGTHNVVETHFLFEPDSGRLVAVQMFPDVDAEPCEVYLDDYRKTGGLLLPYRLEARYAGETVVKIQCNEIQLREAGEP